MQQPETNRIKIRIHPRDKANFLSNFLFCWALPLFVKNYKKDFTEDNIYPNLTEHSSKNLGDELEEKWREELDYRKNPSLLRALFRMFGKKFMLHGLLLFVLEFVASFLQPLCLKILLEYYTPQQQSINKQQACLLSLAIALLNFLRPLYYHRLCLEFASLGLKVRVACCSLIYRKYLQAGKDTCQKFTSGQIINLLSNDVERFNELFVYLHHGWIGPLKLLFSLYYLDIVLGRTAMTGTLIFLLCFFLQTCLVRYISHSRMRVARQTDQRIRLLSDTICGIQMIKMYTWEKPFAKLIELSRKFEILEITKGSLFRITNITFTHYVDKVAVFFCVLVTVLTPLPLTSQYFFALLATFKNFSYSIMTRSQLAATYCAEAQISIKRIQNFLLFEHQESSRAVIQRFVRRNTSFNKPLRTKCVPIIAVKNIDVSIGNCGILSDASFTALAGEVVGVAGAAGSGKSTFLQVILNEVEPQKGVVSVEGVVSYSAQEAWIFSASVRQNILFGQEMDLNKYQTVISACALEDDLSLFPYGDQTLVGERGVMLSGGQKARISLARAIYRNADIYLLDDPLSAVDGHVAMHIFNECILGYLKDKCVVLVTHQVKFLTNVDKVYFIEEGKFVRSENLNKINSLTYEKKTETIDLVKFGTVSEVKEHRSTEAQSQNMYKKYCFARHWSFSVLILIMLGFTQLLLSISDFFVAIWINLTQERRHSTPSVIKNLLPSDIFLYIYSALVVILVLSKHLLAVTYLKYCMSVSKKLHGGLLNTVLFAPMQFFNDHSSGRILNRFSKDIGCIDEIIPAVLFEVINCLFVTIGIFVVISILNYWLILPTLVLLVLFYMFAILFKPTNKCIRRTDGIVKSPVLAHFVTSVQGLITIRAFNSQKSSVQEFENLQDVHSSSFFLMKAVFFTFSFWLDIMIAVYSAIVIFSFLLFETESSAATVGLAVTQALTLIASVQMGMKMWSEVDAHMTSVERVLEYAKLTTEEDNGNFVPQESWPQLGNVEYKSVTMRYSPEKPVVLNQVSFTVKSGEKLGIIGRTGAGKTSVISALFRLFHYEGSIFVDEVDTKSVSLQNLRSKISIISQDPVLFIGSLRKNLDPFVQYTDCEIWKALEDIQMKNVIADLPSGLETTVMEGGANFSVGQKQLLCLARAILRSAKIIVLDEATANIDLNTDQLIQLTIRRRFKECTVLTIAHRLNTVMDSDKILVMDGGQVAEFGEPEELLNNPRGIFYELVSQNYGNEKCDE